MKKVCTLFLGLAALAVATPTVLAQDVYIPTNNGNPDIQIIGEGQFDIINRIISNTNNETVIGLGSVDFGDGNNFKSAYAVMGRGYQSASGDIILCAGENPESATEIVRIPYWNNDLSYQVGRPYGANITSSNVTGVQKVWLKYDGFTDNVMAVGFNADKVYEEKDYIHAEDMDGYWQVDGNLVGKRLRYPNQHPDYNDKKVVLLANKFTKTAPDGDQPRIDTNNNSWGWICDGATIEATDVDFGDKQIQQAVFLVRANGENSPMRRMEIYIDGNKAGSVYCGHQIDANGFLPLVADLDKTYTGANHTVTVKYVVNGPNLFSLELFEGKAWHATLDPDPITQFIEEEPVDDILVFDFDTRDGKNTRQELDNKNAIFNDKWKCTIMHEGQWDGNGNVGYTKDGTVLRITDVNGDAFDFGEIPFSSIIAKYSNDKGNYKGTIEKSNYKLYVDLEEYGPVDFANRDEYASLPPVAQVRVYGTSGWGNIKSIRGEIIDPSQLTGKHKLYIALTSDDGANLYSLHFEVKRTAVEGEIEDTKDGFTVTFDENIKQTGEVSDIVVTPLENEDIEGLSPVVTVSDQVLSLSLEGYPAGKYSISIPEGFVTVGDLNMNSAIEEYNVSIWDAIKAITIAHDQDGLFELSGGEEAELTLNVETVNGKAYDPETEFEVECANNAASHVSAELKDDVVLVTVAETAVKSDSPVAITLKAGNVTSNAMELNHYAAPTTVVLGGTQDEFVEANNTITIADDSEALNYTIALNEGAYQKFLFAAEDSECATIVLTDNGLTITPKAEGTTQFSITPLKAGEFKNDSDPTTPATTYTVVVSHTVGVQIFNANGEEVEIFNLQGVKVANPQNGIFIINGKKVLVK